MTNDNHGESQQHAGMGPGRDPKPVGPRTGRWLILAWTGSMTAWFLLAATGGSLSTPAVALAVGGLIGVVWLLGVIVLSLFVFTPRD